MFLRLTHLLLSVIALATPAAAQLVPGTPQPPATLVKTGDDAETKLSPGAAYREAMRPVEMTRAAVSNWSEIEQASLAVAIKQASQACSERKPSDYSGTTLVDLSRLCALGFSWPTAATAANRYIHEDAASKPRLGEAYAVLINAELQLKDETSALKDVQAMLAALPYTLPVAESTTQAISYMQLIFTSDAVLVATKRQPLLLAALRTSTTNAGEGTDATPTVQDLYKQGLALAELQQLKGQSAFAQKTVDELDSALPPTLSNDDIVGLEGLRRRYALIGKPFPNIKPIPGSLMASMQAPLAPIHNAITVLMLFPDWCAQCLRLAAQMPAGVFKVEGHKASMYGLLAQTVPGESIPKPNGTNQPTPRPGFNPAYAADALRGTPTLTVPPSLLATFNATEFPLLIVTDSHGIVRLLDVANETALQPGDTVDSAVALIGREESAAPK